MNERAIEIRERIRDDRVHYRDSVLTLRESHIVMNALQALEAYEKENAVLRARLEKAVELENKINNGELVDAIWFKSWINGQICCGSVIGYSDGCFVIACGDDLISANKIYISREQARYGLDKKIDKKEE